MKSGNVKQLIIAGLVLGMVGGYWYFSGGNRTTGYAFVGLFVGVITFLLFKMLRK